MSEEPGPQTEEVDKKEKLQKASTAFNALVEKHSRARTKGEKLDEKETQQLIETIKDNASPDELAEQILLNPPTVVYGIDEKGNKTKLHPGEITIEEPTEEEIEYAKKAEELIGPADRTLGRELKHLQAVRRFFLAPKILDEFTDHESQRKPWLNGISGTLQLIDSQTERSEKNFYRDSFTATWNNNKFRKNYRSGVVGAYNLLATYDNYKLGEIKNPPGEISEPESQDDLEKVTDEFTQSCIQIIEQVELNQPTTK